MGLSISGREEIMNTARIILLGTADRRLREWLLGHPEGHERGAIVLFRKFDRFTSHLPATPRFVAVDVIEMDGDWVLDSSPQHLKMNLRKLPEIYWRCEQEDLCLGFVHSHPTGYSTFSDKDNANERSILKGYAGCNGPEVTLVNLILADGSWFGRTRDGYNPEMPSPAKHITVLDDGMTLYLEKQAAVVSEILKRQEAAFGSPFNEKLQSLRVAVVGAGGTGSAAATLLARAGVGELVIIDGDDLEDTNLNRVRGYRFEDVGDKKAAVLAAFIESLGLPTTVIGITNYLHESPDAIDALSSCDVVFGCTDDVAGRDLLNQAVYYYGIVYIDIGLTGKIDLDTDGEPFLRDHRGRISTILPESGKCLRCQRVVTEEKLNFESELRRRPELAELDARTLREEFYLTGGGERAPGVGPFTSASADIAVATLMDLIRRYRKLPSDLRRDNIWHDFVHMTIYSNEPQPGDDCFCCGSNGMLLHSEAGYRLGMPALGKINKHA